MQLGIITLFPEMFETLLCGITGRAIKQQIISLDCWNPRDFATDKHRTVDDRPYGGGPGMLMKVAPLQEAIHTAKKSLGETTKVIYVSPQGKTFTQAEAKKMSQREKMIFVAGRYEGIDERLIETEIDEEWSIGDFVMTNGELAIMAMIDAITRLLPGALGDEASAEQDSFVHGLLDYPHYTRPEIINGLEVPKVLLSGDHKAIEKWRLKQSLGKTWLKKPELLEKLTLPNDQQALLEEFIEEYRGRSHE